jgi:hypothetical protein
MTRRTGLIPLFLLFLLLPNLWLVQHPMGAEVKTEERVLGTHQSTSSTSPRQQVYHGPGIYWVLYGSRDRLADLAVSYDIWEVRPDSGYALMALDTESANALVAQGYRLQLAVEVAEQFLLGPSGYPCYRGVEELYSALQQLAEEHPDLTELLDYGDSWRKAEGLPGHDLWALRIANSLLPGPKPRLFLMAGIHARELVTPETALYFAEYLLENRGSDPDVTWIVDYHEIYVVLTANPDGRQLVEDYLEQDSYCYQRKNRNDTAGNCQLCGIGNHYGVDLNRNNPFHWGGAGTDPCQQTYQGTGAASEPETYHLNALVRSILLDQRPDDDVTPSPNDTTGLLVSLHSYGNLVLYPWGWSYAGAPNESQLQTLGRKLAFFNDYRPQQSVELYPTTGDTVDWAYGELGIPAYTFELGETFFQSCDDLPQIIEENLGALLYAAKVPRRPYVTPSGPDVLDLSIIPQEISAGSSVQLTGTIDDSRYNHAHGLEPTQSIATAVYYVDVPPWITTTAPITHMMAASDGLFNSTQEEVQASLDTTGLSTGRHTIFVRGQDRAGNWGAVSAAFLDVAEAGIFLPLVVEGNLLIDGN